MDKESLMCEALLRHLNAIVEDLFINSQNTKILDCGCSVVTINATDWEELIALSEDCRNLVHESIIPKHRIKEYYLEEEFLPDLGQPPTP